MLAPHEMLLKVPYAIPQFNEGTLPNRTQESHSSSPRSSRNYDILASNRSNTPRDVP